ncbi:tRNA methyltransferase 10 homolog A [Fopius arisanus]|uniref:tRNA (guanine(9)-N(1))-methyltransferase n=1 Tax=Fopius arisanus TaxID=64838 RepID=A0A9R1T9H6_9HYME|nr:PREDICTED: tRNA methyltransferase 10 homolog A [Fopius arisanus]XP_011304968.1 PREDICTED: tRNA methyltransferase 10 homolog A [Fopius arisanus]XP_011304969.1 PREDICTED: tRNA methyltransferase 10 homolog A [Fopius arisanus]XP_011304970.1 PREDICTED: tRNA methyltransferase 10 homolog A [Fopius arisanus]XP_011304971.1 PREDICTED: tRNA methyltransferase 10 homolog A [Fopius arisanus]
MEDTRADVESAINIKDENSERISNSGDAQGNLELEKIVGNLSKRQLKRIKKKEMWLLRKADKRLKERQKTREKRAFARANNIDLGPSRKALKKCTMADSPCKVTVTIDMSFDSLMIDKDIAKLIKQILRCYTLNRRALAPVQFSVTGFSGKSKQEMEKHNGYQHWDVNFQSQSYLEVYDSKKIIYLTSESDNVIDTLQEDFVYVIGGLVDHNQQKGLCHELAQKANVAHARLPLDKFLKMKSRKVLTIDHVFEILLRVTEGITWQDAFLQVLPLRKNAEPMSSPENVPSETVTLDVTGSPEKMDSK